MLSSFVLLVLGVLLLWFPRRWMRRGAAWRVRHTPRPTENTWKRRDERLRFAAEWTQPRNWFDLFRAAVGSLALFGGLGIEPSSVWDVEDSRGRMMVLAIQGGVLFIGLIVQVVRREGGRITFFPPVFYLAGLSVGLCGGWAALFAFTLAWSASPMISHAVTFLMLHGIALAIFGVWLRGVGDVRAAIACLLCLTPALLSLLARRPLVVFSRPAPRGD